MIQDYYGKITYFERTYRDEKEKEFLDNLNDAHATSKDCHWHFNHLSGYTGVVDYSRTALAMQGACERALKDEAHKGKPSGVIVMDFIREFTTSALSTAPRFPSWSSTRTSGSLTIKLASLHS